MRNQQLSMFEFPPHVARSTSFVAAREIQLNAATLRQKVINFLTVHGPSTDEEMQRKIPMNPNTQRPRRRELQQRGLVEPSGKLRKTRSGRMATVWKASAR